MQTGIGGRDRAIHAYRQYLAVKDKPEGGPDRYTEEVRRELQRLLADQPRK